MKTLLTLLTIMTLLVSMSPASAESEGKKRDKNNPEWSPEIRERFQAARMKAMQDPEIQKLQAEAQAANDKFFQAARRKMSEIDPGLAEIVRKKRDGKMGDRRGPGPEEMKREKSDQKSPARGEPKGRPGKSNSDRSGFGSLDENERKSLQEARQKALADPTVQAALAKKDSAQTPEDREAAGEEYRKTMHEAMVKADPSIEPTLKKLAPKPRGSSGPKTDKKPEMGGEMME